MVKINLLPWRTERRKQRQNEFFAMLGGSALLAVLIGYGVVSYFDGLIANQQTRNGLLDREIQAVEAKIKEIETLEKTRANLLSRKQAIEQLQASRSQMVHLFDQLVRTIPEGVRLTSIKQTGQTITFEGVAQSNARVSAYMRSIESSDWMRDPDLTIIEAKGGDRNAPFTFILKVRLTSPDEKAKLESGGATAMVHGSAARPQAGGAA